MQLTERLAKDYQYFFSFALKKTRSYDLAEDVVQDAFLKAESTQSLPKGHYKTWMCRIIRTTIADYYRKQKKHQVMLLHDNVFCGESSALTAEANELSEKLRIIEKTNVSVNIATLFDYAFNDKTYAQLCADYNICFTTARTRIHFGRKKLRQELAEFL